ncbi:hypothetical protein PYW07_006168 [Mythimna separata]|uniref:Uncharacterized protein n=1 Tax=Mythimna separata TaxID=271217 RepID=A0AAD7YJD5_MYTSE|nr:hypothetical protein PYW07_006168 [Mythimna separata]
MFIGLRTPTQATSGDKSPPKPGAAASANVRRSPGVRENTKTCPTNNDTFSIDKTLQAGPANIMTKLTLAQESKSTNVTTVRKSFERGSPPKARYVDRTSEAKACLTKTKLNLGSSRNTKTEIKTAISEAAERLFQLVREAEAELKTLKQKSTKEEGQVSAETKPLPTNPSSPETESANSVLLKTLEQHTKLLAESNSRIEELKERMDLQKEFIEKASYASVAATGAFLNCQITFQNQITPKLEVVESSGFLWGHRRTTLHPPRRLSGIFSA